jgi:hypothetical protein
MSKPFTPYSPSKRLQAAQNSLQTNNFFLPFKEKVLLQAKRGVTPVSVPALYSTTNPPTGAAILQQFSGHQLTRLIKPNSTFPLKFPARKETVCEPVAIDTRNGLVPQKLRHFANRNACPN